MTRVYASVGRLVVVGLLVDRSVIISYGSENFHINAPIGALVNKSVTQPLRNFFLEYQNHHCNKVMTFDPSSCVNILLNTNVLKVFVIRVRKLHLRPT